MKQYWFLLMLAASIPIISETVVKQSAPFSFPMTITSAIAQPARAIEHPFVCSARIIGTNMIALSWRVQGNAREGSISVFTSCGALVQSIPIASAFGTVRVARPAANICFAKVTFGNLRTSSRIILY